MLVVPPTARPAATEARRVRGRARGRARLRVVLRRRRAALDVVAATRLRSRRRRVPSRADRSTTTRSLDEAADPSPRGTASSRRRHSCAGTPSTRSWPSPTRTQPTCSSSARAGTVRSPAPCAAASPAGCSTRRGGRARRALDGVPGAGGGLYSPRRAAPAAARSGRARRGSSSRSFCMMCARCVSAVRTEM